LMWSRLIQSPAIHSNLERMVSKWDNVGAHTP
jgi:hypothetical protein